LLESYVIDFYDDDEVPFYVFFYALKMSERDPRGGEVLGIYAYQTSPVRQVSIFPKKDLTLEDESGRARPIHISAASFVDETIAYA
jgi:hypothetical protein